jgi:hypothetical protein
VSRWACPPEDECRAWWCHHCGAVVDPERWVGGADGLARCPECGDAWPCGFCVCDVLVDPSAEAVAAALRAGSHPEVPA